MSDSTESKDIHWTLLLEKYFSDTGEKCYCYSYLHKKSEQLYDNRRIIIDLPCIILATLNGATSIGSQSLFGGAEMASVGIGLVALFTATLQTIGSYFGWAKRAEAHRIASLQYSKLYRTIAVDLGLPRHERPNVKDFLKNVKDQYDRLQETSPLVPHPIVDHFKVQFSDEKYRAISKPPEANGLERVTVYDPKKDSEIMQIVEDEIMNSPRPIRIPLLNNNGTSETICIE
jgi:hypothetical protein